MKDGDRNSNNYILLSSSYHLPLQHFYSQSERQDEEKR